MATIKAGTMLSFSGGEWSDKWTSGPFNVLRDFDQEETADAYQEGFVKVDKWDKPDEDRFIAWLCDNGYIEDVAESYCWYVGAYGEFTPVIA